LRGLPLMQLISLAGNGRFENQSLDLAQKQTALGPDRGLNGSIRVSYVQDVRYEKSYGSQIYTTRL
jgi:hypothetical protein